jgi:hypothetical protein
MTGRPLVTAKHKFMFKANDDIVSFCACEDVPAMSSGQLDCPWCGCGWLFSCSRCTKSFVFAEVRLTDIPLLELGRQEAAVRGLTVTEEEIAEWAESMATAFDDFEVGDVIVYLDGEYWHRDATDIAFEGLYARHRLDRLPHAEALSDPPLLERVLGDANHWFDRELPDRE